MHKALTCGTSANKICHGKHTRSFSQYIHRWQVNGPDDLTRLGNYQSNGINTQTDKPVN